MPHLPVVIVGGGLSGLSLAYFLTSKHISAQVLEASDRWGGRIQTVQGSLGTPLELGATWLSEEHPRLLALLRELGVQTFPQHSGGISLFQTKSFEPPQKFYVPEADRPSYRIAGGTGRVLDALMRHLDPSDLHLNHPVSGIQETPEGLLVAGADGSTLLAEQVVLCMPIPVLASQLTFTPGLPNELTALLPQVQTWMAGALKFVLEYPDPFWRKEGYSGMLYSHSGIVMEMYDHTNQAEDRFGFTGFLNSGASVYPPELRQELVLQQLGSLFGPRILQPSMYQDKVWNGPELTAGPPLVLRPHQNNGHPALLSRYMHGRLHICGTETATEHPGYMEGAVVAAQTVAGRF